MKQVNNIIEDLVLISVGHSFRRSVRRSIMDSVWDSVYRLISSSIQYPVIKATKDDLSVLTKNGRKIIRKLKK